MFDADALLRQWQVEYKVPGDIIWGGYEELGGSAKVGYTMGLCRYTKYLDAANVWTGRSTIFLDTGMRRAPDFFKTCVLYHEFSHANAYNEDLENDAHNAHFRAYRRRKKLYWIGDMLAKLLSPIWCKS